MDWRIVGSCAIISDRSRPLPTEGVPMSRIGEWAKEHRVVQATGVVLAAMITVLVPLWCVAQDDELPTPTGEQATTVPSQDGSAVAADPPETSPSPPQDLGDEGTTTTAAPPQDAAEDEGSESGASLTSTQKPPASSSQSALSAYENDVELGGCESVDGTDQWCFFAGHATSYVAWRLNTVNFVGADEFFHNRYLTDIPHKWGNATDWDFAASTLGITVDHNPAVGAVAQWERGGGTTYGFVAYVEEVNHDSIDDVTTVTLSYMNADGQAVTTDPDTWALEDNARCSPEQCDLDLGWPDNFIHIKELDPAPTS